MADAIRTRAALQSLLADNVGGDISAQDIRDFLVSTYNWVNDTIGGNIYYMEGSVGIGVIPENVLHLGDLALGEGIKLQNASGGQALDQAWGLEVGISGVDERYFAIYDYARTGGGSAGYRFVITDEDGYVGIGTTNPGALLDIRHANATTTEFKTGIEGGNDIFSIEYVNASPYGARLEGGNNRPIVLQATSTGFVGVKNTNPLEALDVTGNIKASGILTVSGNRMALRTVSDSLANNAAGTVGDMAIGTDTNKYLYIWYATNTPSRVQLDTW